MSNVLIVEDDTGIASFLQAELEYEGFTVTLATTGRKALNIFDEKSFDIILLDIMLPELNGIEVLRRIRKISSVPIIMLTARNETFEKVNGLNVGADDYLTKPFEIEELLARMKSIMRRTQPTLCVRKLTLNPASLEANLNGKIISLSRTEFLLLKLLVENKNKVLSRSDIICGVWGENHFVEDNSVDVYIRYLRSKIDEQIGEEYISTVRGAGYIIRDIS
ncbi:MAG: response regulator transcription factor [Spirochaetales bacterium]